MMGRLVSVGCLCALAQLAVSCGANPDSALAPRSESSDAGAPPADTVEVLEETEFGGPETMHALRETSCPAAGITVLWRGVTVRPPIFQDRGLRSVVVRFADGEEVEFESLTLVYDWPEVVFSPDCQRVALLRSRSAPYAIVATRELRAYLKGERAVVRYLDDQKPCALEFQYGRLAWVSNNTVEYESSGLPPFHKQRANVDQAPTRVEPKPCLDPKHPLYEGPEIDAGIASPGNP